MQLPFRHSATGATIFSVMSSLASEYNAINLSQGFPDFPLEPELAALLHEAATGNFNQYAPMAGLPVLREAIARDLFNRYSVQLNSDSEVTVTPGATYAIYTAFTSILSPGDEVIVLEPAYDSYIPNIEMNGARAVCVSLVAPEFAVDWNTVRDAITAKTRAIIVNTPHNPTGAVWSAEDWNQLSALVRDTDIIVISDEVYEQLIFDKRKHHSVLEHPELRQRSFAVYSFGKVFNNTGWKMGYVIAPEKLTNIFRHVHQFISFSVNSPAQYAIAKYLEMPSRPDVGDVMEGKRDLFLGMMEGLPFTIHRPAAGSYFQLAGYEQLSDMDDVSFARFLTTDFGVATIPVSPFYCAKDDHKLLRFCFAKKPETLEQAITRLRGVSAFSTSG